MDRAEALRQIIEFGPYREEAYGVLLGQPFSSDDESVIASVQSLLQMLRKYLDDQIDVDDVEEWAMFIDCCDDIDASLIEDYIYALCNPELMGSVDKAKAAVMIELLNSSIGG